MNFMFHQAQDCGDLVSVLNRWAKGTGFEFKPIQTLEFGETRYMIGKYAIDYGNPARPVYRFLHLV